MESKLLTALQELQPGKWGELPRVVECRDDVLLLQKIWKPLSGAANIDKSVILELEKERREDIQSFYDICKWTAECEFNTIPVGCATSRISAYHRFKSLTGLSFDQVYEKMEEKK